MKNNKKEEGPEDNFSKLNLLEKYHYLKESKRLLEREIIAMIDQRLKDPSISEALREDLQKTREKVENLPPGLFRKPERAMPFDPLDFKVMTEEPISPEAVRKKFWRPFLLLFSMSALLFFFIYLILSFFGISINDFIFFSAIIIIPCLMKLGEPKAKDKKK